MEDTNITSHFRSPYLQQTNKQIAWFGSFLPAVTIPPVSSIFSTFLSGVPWFALCHLLNESCFFACVSYCNLAQGHTSPGKVVVTVELPALERLSSFQRLLLVCPLLGGLSSFGVSFIG